MTFQCRVVSSASRQLACVGRRCRVPARMSQSAFEYTARFGSARVTAPASAGLHNIPFPASGWGRGAGATAVVLSRERGSGTSRQAFSTSPAEGEKESGDAAKSHSARVAVDGATGEEAGTEATAAPQGSSKDFDPLDGIAQDDGDPGPPPPLDPSIVTEPSPKVVKLVEEIDSLDFMEMAMLINIFKDKLGLDEVPSLSYGGEEGGGLSGGEGGAAEAGAEKDVLKVRVTGFNDKAKIKVIKEIRAITGLGLREAKELVESLPQVVKEDMKPEEAEAMKQTLEAVGATVELE